MHLWKCVGTLKISMKSIKMRVSSTLILALTHIHVTNTYKQIHIKHFRSYFLLHGIHSLMFMHIQTIQHCLKLSLQNHMVKCLSAVHQTFWSLLINRTRFYQPYFNMVGTNNWWMLTHSKVTWFNQTRTRVKMSNPYLFCGLWLSIQLHNNARLAQIIIESMVVYHGPHTCTYSHSLYIHLVEEMMLPNVCKKLA